MRWVFAGFAFALLVSLAIATVALRSENVKTRAELRAVQHELVVFSIDCGRREHGLQLAASPEALAERWRAIRAIQSSD